MTHISLDRNATHMPHARHAHIVQRAVCHHKGANGGMEDQQSYRGVLRLPAGLAERLKEAARLERRSMNSQIIVLLERALPENEKADTAATASA